MSEWTPEYSGRGGASVGTNGVCAGQLRAGSTASRSVASGAVTERCFCPEPSEALVTK